MLFLHGGAYVIGSPASHCNLTAHLARSCALRLAVPDYRLAPEHPFPAALDDALAAYKGLLELGVAPQDIILSGDSAGGGLALACAVSIRDAGLPLPAALVLVSPWADLGLAGTSIEGNKDSEIILTHKALADSAQMYLAGKNARTPLASPLFANLAGLPPLLIQVTDAEMLYDDSVRLAEAASAAGVSVELDAAPRLWHDWQIFAGQLPEADYALARIARFVSAKLGHS
jgi:acetyl esterase/lipase